MKKIILLGEPKSSQTIYKYHCKFGFPTGYMSAKGKSVKEDYQWQIKSQWHSDMLLKAVKLTVTLFFSRKGVHDVDNFNKLVLDALSGIVYSDDVQVEELTIIKKFDLKNPRVEVEIYDKTN